MTAQVRLTTGVWISALRRRVEAAGGFAAVIAKGDAAAGSVILLLRAGNGKTTAISKVNMGTGEAGWQKIYENRRDDDDAARQILDKRRCHDPDLWIVELDVSDPARFVDGDILES